MSDLSNYRKSYEKSELSENKIPEDPINLFHKWFYETEEFGTIEEVNAMTVSTIGIDGFPKNRDVLLKSLMKKDLFFTPITTQKRKSNCKKSNVCLSFLAKC
jgi:pyridoxamine 5'-phosphate oxidase